MQQSSPDPPRSKSSRASESGSNERRPTKNQRVTNACQACKKRKTKCEGVIPCSACVAQGIECVIDPSRDMRRRSSIRRTYGESTPFLQTLEAFVDAIRNRDPQNLNEVLEFVKTRNSSEEAVAALKESLIDGRILIDSNTASTYASNSAIEDSLLGKARSSPSQSSAPKTPSVKFAESSSTTTPTRPPQHIPHDLFYDLQDTSASVAAQDRSGWHPALQVVDDVDLPDMLPDGTDVNEVSSPIQELSFLNHMRRFQPATDPSSYHILARDRPDGQYLAVGLGVDRMNIPTHLLLPLSSIENSVMCRLFSDFLDAARHMLLTGTPVEEILDANDVFVDLFFRQRRHQNEQLTASSWASEVVSRMLELDDFMRLAWVVLLTLMVRWLLFPTKETYEDVPTMMRPVWTQRIVSHVGSIDVCPFPVLRQSLIYRNRDWITALVKSQCSVNWTRSMAETVERDEQTGAIKLTKQFRAHAMEAENWSVSGKILDDFQEVEGRIKITDTDR